MDFVAQDLAKKAGMRSGNDVGSEISRFHWYLKNPEQVTPCLPPIEIIPAEVLHRAEDNEDPSDDTIEMRVVEFVQKLIKEDWNAWKALTKKLTNTREAHAYLPDFASISPWGNS